MNLTDSQIMDFPIGYELDSLMAIEVMGWTWEKVGQDPQGHPDANEFGEWSIVGNGNAVAPRSGWSPSTNIADAWVVWEKFSPEGNESPILVLKQVWGMANDPHPCWTCNLGGGWAPGDYAPDAICRAALLALKYRKEMGPS